ncbi:hypothetical protein WJ45_32260 [Burkholderia ubonensis]|nr:hypothetical protein WJ45_32260 [Burkholderia ubonensis]KVQ55985.1 hypothetical protein WK04_31155 [Burkholderia ubonensis]
MNREPVNEIYMLGDANMPLCSGLRFATIYKSADDLVLASGVWMYAFQRATHPPMNAERALIARRPGRLSSVLFAPILIS